MTADRVVGQLAHLCRLGASGEELKRAHAQMTRGNAREDCARLRTLTHHRDAGGRCGQRASGRNTERVHGLTDEVLA